MDVTPLALALTGLLVGLSLSRYSLLDLTPVARNSLFEHLQDAVLVLDSQLRLVDLNPSAQRVLALTSAAIGKPIAQICVDAPALLALCEGANDSSVELMCPATTDAVFAGQRTPLPDRQGRQIGCMVVLNLLINAAEAIGSGSGTITVTITNDHLEQSSHCKLTRDANPLAGAYVCLTVTDTGCGMDAQTLVRIFEPFITTKFLGRGLGLPAVRGIVHSHGGTLDVTSALGQGTTFRIWLPAWEDTLAELASPPMMHLTDRRIAIQ